MKINMRPFRLYNDSTFTHQPIIPLISLFHVAIYSFLSKVLRLSPLTCSPLISSYSLGFTACKTLYNNLVFTVYQPDRWWYTYVMCLQFKKMGWNRNNHHDWRFYPMRGYYPSLHIMKASCFNKSNRSGGRVHTRGVNRQNKRGGVVGTSKVS